MHDHRSLDIATGASAMIAAFSFWQGVALALTIIAAVVSIACGIVRLYDRFHSGRQ